MIILAALIYFIALDSSIITEVVVFVTLLFSDFLDFFCSVSDCNNDGFRSLNTKKVEEAGLRVSVSGKKAALCKEHYKEWKKETKEDRSLDRARFDIY